MKDICFEHAKISLTPYCQSVSIHLLDKKRSEQNVAVFRRDIVYLPCDLVALLHVPVFRRDIVYLPSDLVALLNVAVSRRDILYLPSDLVALLNVDSALLIKVSNWLRDFLSQRFTCADIMFL